MNAGSDSGADAAARNRHLEALLHCQRIAIRLWATFPITRSMWVSPHSMAQIPADYTDPIFSWEERASHQEGLLTMLQNMERDLQVAQVVQNRSPPADLSRPQTHAAAMTSLEGERNLNLSRPAAHAAAMTSFEGGAAGATEDLSVPVPCSKTLETAPPSSAKPKKKMKMESLLSRIMDQPMDQRLAAIDACMKEIEALPLELAKYSTSRQKQQTFLAFALYAIKTTGVALNGCVIVEAYKDYCRESPVTHEKPNGQGHENFFTQHPAWIVLLWKHAGVSVNTTDGMQRRSLAAFWGRNKHRLRELLAHATEWLIDASEDPAAAALLQIRRADPTWPLFGEDVDRHCLLSVIHQDVLLREQNRLRQNNQAQVCFDL